MNRQLERLIGIGDIHGKFNLLKSLIETQIIFDPGTDTLVMLGDYIDRGKDSAKVIRYVCNLRDMYPGRIILLKGNHELTASQYLKANEEQDLLTWKMMGGNETIVSFGGLSNVKNVLMPFIASLSIYHETEKHVFVHGGIPFGLDLKTATESDLLWERNSTTYRGEKMLVVGHAIHECVTKYRHVIACDTGAFISGKLSGYDVLNDVVYEAIEKTEHINLFLSQFGRN